MKQQGNESQAPPEPGANYGEMAIAFIALVPELLLHDPRTFGIRSVAARGGGAVLAMYIFALFYDHDNTRPLLILTLVIAVLAITAYLSAAINERRPVAVGAHHVAQGGGATRTVSAIGVSVQRPSALAARTRNT